MPSQNNPEQTSIHVLLADDHGLVRAGIRQILEHSGAIMVVGEAGDGETAQAMMGRFHSPGGGCLSSFFWLPCSP